MARDTLEEQGKITPDLVGCRWTHGSGSFGNAIAFSRAVAAKHWGLAEGTHHPPDRRYPQDPHAGAGQATRAVTAPPPVRLDYASLRLGMAHPAAEVASPEDT